MNVIGAGLAGLSAARMLAMGGQPCRLVSPQVSERAQSVLAEGGINAAMDIMGEDDRPVEHFNDTMRGAVWLSDPNAVWGMAQGAPGVVRDFIAMGVPFQTEHGRMIQRNFGGQKKKRTAYAKSSTGKVLVTALIDAVRAFEATGEVERMPRHELVQLEVADGACAGVWVRDVYTGGVEFCAGPVLLASGGMGGLLGPLTTGTTQNTGDVTAAVFAQGVEMGNLEMLQYHPTTTFISGKRMLISEAARGEGGRLFVERDGEPWYFMEELYPELGNLMPRDVVSREEYKVLHDPACGDQVWLDMRGLGRAIWRDRLSDLREECVHYLAIDPATDPLPVEPGIHYCMGGVLVDEGHRTNIANLYAAGECACQYHGANRLGGNSLLGACYGGRVAAQTMMSDLDRGRCAFVPDAPATSASDVERVPGANDLLLADNATELAMQGILVRAMGIVRDAEGLQRGLRELDDLDADGVSVRMEHRLQLARALVLSALERKESRGAHWRSDYPDRDDAGFHRTTVASVADGEVAVSLRDIPALREHVAGMVVGPEVSR